MTQPQAQYVSGVVSGRSRRLRTIAAILLVAVIGMAFYGAHVLVPTVNRAAAIAARPGYASANRVGAGSHKPLHIPAKEANILKFDVIFVSAYWVVWTILVLTLIMVAWLDLREVSRNYLNQRRELWSAASKAAIARGAKAELIEDSGADTDPPASS